MRSALLYGELCATHSVQEDLDADLSGIFPDSLCSSYRSGRSALGINVQLAVAIFPHADISRKCSRGKNHYVWYKQRRELISGSYSNWMRMGLPLCQWKTCRGTKFSSILMRCSPFAHYPLSTGNLAPPKGAWEAAWKTLPQPRPCQDSRCISFWYACGPVAALCLWGELTILDYPGG